MREVYLTDEEFRGERGSELWQTAPVGTVLVVAARPLNRAERRAGIIRRSDGTMRFVRTSDAWVTED